MKRSVPKRAAAGAVAAQLQVNPIRGRRPAPMNCTIGELNVDPSYQRSVENGPSRVLIRKIAREWDWSLFQLLVVSRRPDGALYVVDGQHRLEAARLRRDLYDLPCSVYDFATTGDEADAFVAINQQRKPLGALDLFRAAVEGGGCGCDRGCAPDQEGRSFACPAHQFHRLETGPARQHLRHPQGAQDARG